MLGTQPTTGVKGAQPNLPTRETFTTAKQELPELSRSHLQTRNRQMASKAALAEVTLLEKKQILLPKALVTLQLGILLTGMRQHILGFVSTLPHRLIGTTEHEMSIILRAELHRLLKDLAQWPSRAVDPNWQKQIDQDLLPTPEEKKD
jgi:hypothetical protein